MEVFGKIKFDAVLEVNFPFPLTANPKFDNCVEIIGKELKLGFSEMFFNNDYVNLQSKSIK